MRSPSSTVTAHLPRLVVAGFCLFAFTCVASATDFVAPRAFPAGKGANFGIAVADFNHDGNLDTAVFAYTGSGENVNVIMGNGNGAFQAPVSYAVGSNPQQMLTADFNHDGYADIAVSTYSGEQILINNGDGTFQPAVTYNAFGVGTVADFNGDGNLDIAVTEYDDAFTDYVDVMLGNGDGTFQAVKQYKGGACAYQAAAGDFNHDGKIDLVLANGGCGSGSETNQFTVLLGNGDGSFQPPVAYADNAPPYQVAVGDFNRDGNLDVAVVLNAGTNVRNGEVDIYLGNGDGTFTKSKAFPSSSDFGGVIVTDFNNDGFLDIATAGESVSLLLGNGDGTFRPATNYQPTAGFAAMAAGDFKNNGMADVVTVGEGMISLLLDQPGGALHAAKSYSSGVYPANAALADFNGDGANDVVTAGTPLQGQKANAEVSVLFNSGQQGVFRRPGITTILPGTLNTPGFVATGDFNGDHKQDVAVSIRETGGNEYVTILLGKGDGTFTIGSSYEIAAGSEPQPILIADLNHDGILDIAAGCGYTVCILLGHGDGTFAAPQAYAAGGNSFSSIAGLAVGDVNGDGKLDLVATNSQNLESGLIAILLGNGDGTFAAPVTYKDRNESAGVVLADFNGDGNLDIAVADNVIDNPSAVLGVLLGNGNGTFQAEKFYEAGSALLSTYAGTLAVADFNADGNLDIAMPTNFEFSVLHGKGDGTFGVPVVYGGSGLVVAVGAVTSKPGPDAVLVDGLTTVYLNNLDQ